MEAFKAAHYFSPQKVHEIQPTASSIDCLKAFPFFDSKDLEGLKGELPTYLAKAADVDSSIDPMHWWRLNASTLLHWAVAACRVLLVQQSSAASKRVFSLLNASFDDQQEGALQDNLERTVMLQYNTLKSLFFV